MKEETIGMRIRHVREAMKYSQEQVAIKADISQQHLSRIENDNVNPTMDTLIKIAKALGVSVTSLCDAELLIMEEKCIFEMMKKLERMTFESKMKVSGYCALPAKIDTK